MKHLCLFILAGFFWMEGHFSIAIGLVILGLFLAKKD